MSHLAGHAAEDAVARDYTRRGHPLIARCWRGTRGELDLVFGNGDGLIVVEVKQAPDFDRALAHLGPAQLARIHATAEEFAATQPRGRLTELRFDIALVDGTGQLQLLENFWA